VMTVDEDAAWTQVIYEEALEAQPRPRAEAARPPVAAVVLNYNTPDDTLLAVRSLQASCRPLDHLIVVDNGPDESCERALAPCRGAVRFIRSPGNVGFSAGCNIGIRAALDAGAEFVLLMNSDAVLAPDALERLERALAAEPAAGIAAPLILSRAEPGTVASAGISYSTASGRMRHQGFGGRTEDFCEGPAWAAEAVSGCVMLIRRAVFEAAGLLDERYFFSFEDIEFCLRVRRAGLSSLLVPSALAYHEGHLSIGPASSSRLYYASRNHLLLAQSALPMRGVRAVTRTAGIVSLNLAYALRVPNVATVPALRAVIAGTADYLRRRFGQAPGSRATGIPG
jgi:GT2 family glycosyltransferase